MSSQFASPPFVPLCFINATCQPPPSSHSVVPSNFSINLLRNVPHLLLDKFSPIFIVRSRVSTPQSVASSTARRVVRACLAERYHWKRCPSRAITPPNSPRKIDPKTEQPQDRSTSPSRAFRIPYSKLPWTLIRACCLSESFPTYLDTFLCLIQTFTSFLRPTIQAHPYYTTATLLVPLAPTFCPQGSINSQHSEPIYHTVRTVWCKYYLIR